MKKRILCLILAALLLAGCSVRKHAGDSGDAESTTKFEQAQADTADGTAPVDGSLTVYKTKYCDLKYPSQWADAVQVVIDESAAYTVTFAMNDGTPIFDLIFNGYTGYVLGTLLGEAENTIVRMNDHTMDKSDSRYEEFCAMVEDVNVILENLGKDYSFVMGQEIRKEDDSTFEIKTRLCSMQYPAKWKEQADIAVSDDAVRFSCGEYKLFDLLFGNEEGYLLGTYDGETVSIVSYDIDASAMNEEMYRQLCAMQEDVNVILQYLMEDAAFEIAG